MPGAERLRDNATLESLVKAQMESGRLLAAICATPAVFLEVSLGFDGVLTCNLYPLYLLIFQEAGLDNSLVDSCLGLEGAMQMNVVLGSHASHS